MDLNSTGGGSHETLEISDDDSSTDHLKDPQLNIVVVEQPTSDPLVSQESVFSGTPLSEDDLNASPPNRQEPMDTSTDNENAQKQLLHAQSTPTGGNSSPLTASVVSQTANKLPSITNSSSTSTSAIPRPRAYPQGSKGPFLVFFRPKGKPLNKPQIEKDLEKSFRGILSVDSPSRNRLRVTVSEREEANRIAAHELFLMEYRTYILSREVEIAGVVTEPYLSCAEIKSGVGGFKNRAVPPVDILDVRQMNHVASDGTKKPSNSYHVIFSGSALPEYLILGKLRLPVRLYEPTVMHCGKCQQIGHTTPFCCNKPRCGKCGEQHVDGDCREPPKCLICGQGPHELSECPKFIERGKHQIRSLQQRSRRTYAEMLKQIAPPVDPAAPPAQSIISNNVFTPLAVDDQGSDSEDGIEYSVIQTGTKRKRVQARHQRQQQQASEIVPAEEQTTRPPLEKSRSVVNTTKTPPPGFNSTPRECTSLPGTSKTPGVLVFHPESRQNNLQAPLQEPQQEEAETSDKMTLSEIVDIIFETLEVSPETRKLLKMVLSLVKPLLKRLTSKWPVLDSLISFDG